MILAGVVCFMLSFHNTHTHTLPFIMFMHLCVCSYSCKPYIIESEHSSHRGSLK